MFIASLQKRRRRVWPNVCQVKSREGHKAMHEESMLDGCLRYVFTPEVNQVLSYTYYVTYCRCVVVHQLPGQASAYVQVLSSARRR